MTGPPDLVPHADHDPDESPPPAGATGPSRRGLLGLAALGSLGLAGCTGSGDPPAAMTRGTSPSGRAAAVVRTGAAASATSAQQLGGLDALIRAAQREGGLNVISLQRDWVGYGEIIDTFQSTYRIPVTSTQPDASSQEEIDAVNALRGRPEAPDVLDLGLAVAMANTDLFAPYQVQTWADVPDDQKEPSGLWVQDYGGYMAVGYDSARVPEPASLGDLLKAPYRDAVALTGDPNQSNTALNAVVLASMAVGGSPDDVSEGIRFFAQLNDAGNFLPVQASRATVRAGQTPVVFDWDYASPGVQPGVPGWRVFLPPTAMLSSFYAQAVSRDAPHPAAARLWQEFLFSDKGQNLFLQAGARPVRLAAMVEAGTAEATALQSLPTADVGRPTVLTEAQVTAARKILATQWSPAVS